MARETVLPTNVANGQTGHAGKHNATNAQVNYLTTALASILTADGDLGPLAAGKGVLLTSPDGTEVRRVRIDNTGTIVADDPGDVGGATGYAAEVLADSPISYWRLGETSGTTANDETNAHDGTYAGGVTLGTTGLAGDSDKAITLDGTDDHVVVKNNGAILAGLTNWTIEAVVKLDATGVVYSERGSSGLDILNIEVGGAGKVKLIYRDHAGTIDEVQSTSSLIATGDTHHIAVTKSGTTVKFYVDGTLDGTQTLAASNTFGEASIQAWIGADATGGSWYDGVLDEVAIYNAALTAGRIAAHAAAMA